MLAYRSILHEQARPSVIRESRRAPWLAVSVVCFGAFMGQLDASIVTITFPAMERDFSVPVAAVQWVSLIYLLGLIALLAPAGRLGDAVGRKLVYTYGFAVFTVASAACGLAPSLGALVALRLIQPGRRPGQHGPGDRHDVRHLADGAGPAPGYPELSGRQSWICGSSRVPWDRAGAARVHRPRRRCGYGGRDRASQPGQARGQVGVQAGVPGRRTRQVQIAEGNVAQEQVGPERIGPEQLGGEQIGPELADIVSRLRRAMRRAARAADPALGLSVAQLELLSCITEHPGIRPSQLARLLRLAPSSVATLLGGLQTAGYVMRTPGGSAGDRRTVSLDLSEAGAAAVMRWHQVNEDVIQAALAALPHRDRAALRDAAPALRDLTASIDAQAD